MAALFTAACTRAHGVETASPPPPALGAATSSPSPLPAEDAGSDADVAAAYDAAPEPWKPPAATRIDGPHEELSLVPGRPIWYALARRATDGPARLVGHLHGMCGPPPYACGKWVGAGTDVGLMVCPTGNARCGESPYSPPSWEAPSWDELVAIMDADLEASIAKVAARRPGVVRRTDAILTGYSRGAYAAPVIARRHPKRWPYLVLIEANVPLGAEGLRAAGVRAVALVAGEQGTEIAGMRKTQVELEGAGFPARLFVMRRTGHLYSDDMELVMHEALAYVLAYEPRGDAGTP